MPQYSTLTLGDGQAPTVNHAYTVQSVKPDLISFSEKQSGVPFIGWPELVIRHRAPIIQRGRKTADGVFREEFTLKIPVMDTTSPSTASGVQPVPTVGFVNQVKVTFLVSERATDQQKKDLRALVVSVINSASVRTQVENSEGIWT